MVINTKYKFIFIHIPKAAGTSVMNCLSDIEGNHTRWLPGTKHETLSEFFDAFASRRSISDRLAGRDPQSYFTFGFVRHPWDRMSSFYRYLVEKRPRPEIESVSSFKDFLQQAQDGVDWIQGLYAMKPQLDYFTLANNRMDIDFLGHFEYLQEDIRTLAGRLNCEIKLGHENRSSNTGRDYRDQYDDETIEIVASRFSEEIELFGYSFDEKHPGRRCSTSLNQSR